MLNAISHDTALYRKFLQENVPSIKRIGSGHIALMELLYKNYRSHTKIGIDDKVFVPSATMQSLTRDYVSIRDATCIMKGYSNFADGTCDLIVGWIPAFSELSIRLQTEAVKTALSIRRSGESILYLVIKEKANEHKALSQAFFPGADLTGYAPPTDKTHRPTHWLQNMKREHRRVAFAACMDFDIQSCFPQIFRQRVLQEGTYPIAEHPFFQKMVDEPEAWIASLIAADCWTYTIRQDILNGCSLRDAAKAMRSRLFHPGKNGTLADCGWAPYDSLKDWILGCLRAREITNVHLFFTEVEQEILETAMTAAGRPHVLVRMHDGFIADGLARPHDALVAIEAATGFKWKMEIL